MPKSPKYQVSATRSNKRRLNKVSDGVSVTNVIEERDVELTPEELQAQLEQEQADLEAERQKEADRQIVDEAMERFRLCEEAESENRQLAIEDVNFSIGKQWNEAEEKRRVEDGRPVLTTNRIQQFISHMTGEQRQNRPDIIINPVDDASDPKTAEVFQGLIRHIEQQSHAQVAYDHAFECALRGGFGYWRVLSDYLDDGTDNQELYIKRIKNPFCVYFDPSCVEADYSDASFAFVFEDMPRKQYEREYPNSEVLSLIGKAGVGNNLPNWLTKDFVRVAEYFRVEEEETETLSGRKRRVRKVIWSKINAREVLETKVWQGLWIPIIPVLGHDLDIDGKRYLAGMVRDAKSPARMYNYWISAATEMVARPKEPYRAAEGQLEGHENEWKMSGRRPVAVLTYKPVVVTSSTGQSVVLPPPSREGYNAPIGDMAQMTLQADNDIKATMGLYDASLGRTGPEQSGKAILARQQQGQLSNLHFIDNLSRAKWHTARILLDLIPKVYDAPRVQRIVLPNQDTQRIGLYNSQTAPEGNTQITAKDLQGIYDVGVGRYDVVVGTGKGSATARQESAETLLALVQAYPILMQSIGDILLGQMDFPEAKTAAKRLKKMLPPPLQEDEGADPAAQLQQAQAKMQMILQQHEALTQQLEQATEIIRTKKMELDNQKEIEAMRIKAEMLVSQAKLESGESQTALKLEFEKLRVRLDHLMQERELALKNKELNQDKQIEEEKIRAAAKAKAKTPQRGE